MSILKFAGPEKIEKKAVMDETNTVVVNDFVQSKVNKWVSMRLRRECM